MRRARKFFFRAFASLIVLGLLTGGLLYWRRDQVATWFRDRAIALFVKRIQPELPFLVESVELKPGSWRDLWDWRIPHLALVLRKDPWRVRMSGVIDVDRRKRSGNLAVTYKPETFLERVDDPSVRIGPLVVDLRATLVVPQSIEKLHDLADIRRASLRVTAEKLAWAPFGVDLAEPRLRLDWRDGQTDLAVGAKSLTWTEGNRTVMVVEPGAKFELPIEMRAGESPPYRIGEAAAFGLQAKSAEALLGDDYLAVPGDKLELAGLLRLNGLKPSQAEFEIGTPSVALRVIAGLEGSPYPVRWETRGTLDLKAWLEAILRGTTGSTGPLAALGELAGLGLSKGGLRAHGDASISFPDFMGSQGGFSMAIRGLDLDWKEKGAAIRGLSLELQASRRDGLKGSISADRLLYKKLEAKLSKLPFSVTPVGKVPEKEYVVRIGEGDRLPLTVGGVPLRIGTLVGSLDVRTREYELTTNLQLPPIGIEKIAPLFCLPRSKLPPAIVTASFPKIELWNGAIEPEGRAWIELFGGTIELKELALYDLTEVPEAGFDLEIEGVKLRDLGDWSGFGEIDGVLTGYARDVVMKSWLPTRFDLLIEPKPLDGSWKLTFSPEAMENTVRLLAEDAVDQMPGIARWFFFGWPAHLVFGYDVKYAGISAYSKDGNILLETLDPMDPRDRNAACGENHFILCGTRFKIPLKSSSYPVLIDNTAMFSFLKKRGEYLLEFAAAKQREREALEAKKAPKKESDADDGSKACLPEVLE